jgi:hypothetical protein
VCTKEQWPIDLRVWTILFTPAQQTRDSDTQAVSAGKSEGAEWKGTKGLTCNAHTQHDTMQCEAQSEGTAALLKLDWKQEMGDTRFQYITGD